MIKNRSNPPRTHHFIPRFQLEYFEFADGTIQQYDCKQNKYSRPTKEHLAAENHLYTWTDERGNKNTIIEKIFGDLEGQISQVVRKVNDLDFKINNEERSLLSLFVAMQMYRTPQNRDRTKAMIEKMTKKMMKVPAWEPKIFKNHIQKASKKNPELENMKPGGVEKMRKMFLEEDYDLVVPNEYFLKFMIEGLTDIATHIHEIGWVFLISTPKSQFITSDDPYVMYRQHRTNEPFWIGPGIKIKGTEITFPLTPKVCLLMSPSYQGLRSRTIDQKIVREINLRTASRSRRFLYGGNEIMLASIVKYLSLDTRGVRTPSVIVDGL